MPAVRHVVISADEAGQRIDNFLFRMLKGVPKSHIYRMIRQGDCRVNKKRIVVSYKLQAEDIVRIPPVRDSDSAKANAFVGEKLQTTLMRAIIYEDSALLVVNKPSGIAVHGGSGVSLGVIEALRQIRSELPYLELVHRLDRETSGVLVLAKKRSALRALHALLATREVEKTYWALVHGSWLAKKSLWVRASLAKQVLQSGERMVQVEEEGKASETKMTLIESFPQASLIEAKPKTGRTHQIRVHAASIHHPIVGDEKYGGSSIEGCGGGLKKRLYLHAKAMEFELNGQRYQFNAPLDEPFSAMLQSLRQSQLKESM